MASKVLDFPSPADEVADETLIVGCASGDARALATLYDRHGPAVERFLGRMAGVDRQDLADLTQACFLQVWTSARRFRGDSQARTWIFAIAANLARGHIRSDVRRKRMLALFGQRPPPRGADPARAAAVSEATERLGRAIAALPLSLREAFVLCQIEGLPGVEAARALGVPEGTLYRRMHEARARVRAAIEGRE